ncbi:MAG: hypothetical protein EA362_05660 [Saprospirales bacterium]|nr:MAG: hypothetical protein EA362_05660 [Saprospirales bacterium]
MKKLFFLLDLEMTKYKSNITMKVLLLSLVVIFPLAVLLVSGLIERIAVDQFRQILLSADLFWMLSGYISNWLVFFFMSFLGIFIVTMEYSNNTLRQNLITGLNRVEFLLSKLLSLAVISLLLTLWFYFITILFSIYLSIEIEFNPYELLSVLSAHVIMCFGYGVVGLLFGMVFKSMGLSIILFLLYASILEPAFAGLAHRSILGGNGHLFYPLNTIKDLFPFPYLEFANTLVGPEENLKFSLSIKEALLSSSTYILIFIGLAYIKMKKGNF